MSTCFVVGNGAIALKCLEVLLQSNWTVSGVYSEDGSLQAWANSPHAASRQAFAELLSNSDYDYLFSINNNWILPPELIVRAKQATINYHNSLLPKYAGLHAPTWALLHGETEHGISWHEVVTEIDAGQILKQIRLPIQPDDTALSLNARCFEAAIAGFSELVAELTANTVKPVMQNVSERSYFGRYQRPSAAGLLAFEQDAATLYNLVRGLDFGPTPNPLGLPKLWLPAGVVAVGSSGSVCLLDPPLKAQPGEVLGLDDETGLWIAALNGSLRFSCLTSLTGEPLTAKQLSCDYGVRVGDILPSLSPEMRQAITEQNRAICRYEQQWVEHLAQLTPFVHPYLDNFVAKTSTAEPSETRELQRYPISTSLDANSQLAAFAAYCVRLSSEPVFDLALQTEVQRSLAPELFAQQVPIRIVATPLLSFAQFQQQFQAVVEQANRCQSYALDVAARYPDLRHVSQPTVTLVLAPTPADLAVAGFDSLLNLVAYTDGSLPELVHRGSLLDADSQSMVHQLETLIAACKHNPQQSLHTLPLLSTVEQQQMLVEWNATTKPYPNRLVHQLVTEQAARTPDAPAIRFQQTRLSYRELDQRSNQLAHWLQQQGIQPNDRVGVCLPRSVELVIALLGILKAGATYVPIDPTYPAERIAYLLSDSNPKAVISLSSQNFLPAVLPPTIAALYLDQQAVKIAEMPTIPVVLETTPNLAYLIYTSGSTGKPKGVEISHRALVNHSWAMANLYRLGTQDRVLQSASISFDIAAEQIYPALFRGAEVILRPDDLLESFYRFSAFVTAEAVTVLILPTAFWHEWVAELVSRTEVVPASLRAVAVGTESVQAHRLSQWQTLSGGRVAFFQGYGPTEATITCTVYRHPDQFGNYQAAHLTEIPIGRPLPNTEIYILDSQLQPLPVGIVGELYIGGVGLAEGYYQKPQLTSERFISHLFHPGKRLYKTGDLARFQSDGQIIYCGRNDNQIKLRGFRIELGEIEAVMAQFPGVRQAVVQADAGRLLAYVVLEVNLPACQTSSTEFSVASLQSLLRQHLPDYMLPASVTVLDALPLLPNGKVNRRALPQPTPSKLQTAIGDPVERQLIHIWKSLLGVEPTSVDDNFFELGGSSLTAVRLADRLQTHFRQKLPLAAIFNAPTVAQLAEVIRSDSANAAEWSTLVPIRNEGQRPPLFLFQGVEIYYPLVAHLAPDQPVYSLSLEMVDQNELVSGQVEQFAERYLRDLRLVQPQGPYLLGGLSFGGVVALEVAQRLQAEGKTVALLAVFDTAAPGAFIPKPLPQRLLGHLENLLKYKLVYASKKLTGIGQQIYLKLTQRFNFEHSHTEQHLLLEVVYQQLAAQYQFRAYSGRVALFLATDRSAVGGSICDPALNVIDPEFGWGKFVQNLAVYHTPGNHIGILREPQVRFLAKRLQDCLDEAVKAAEHQLML
jgi:amino acid adenylation domain-containing protein